MTFFQQGTLPCISADGRFIMETPYKVQSSSTSKLYFELVQSGVTNLVFAIRFMSVIAEFKILFSKVVLILSIFQR